MRPNQGSAVVTVVQNQIVGSAFQPNLWQYNVCRGILVLQELTIPNLRSSLHPRPPPRSPGASQGTVVALVRSDR